MDEESADNPEAVDSTTRIKNNVIWEINPGGLGEEEEEEEEEKRRDERRGSEN